MIERLEPIAAPPDENELGGRLDKVRALMSERGLDYYVSFDPINVYYLSISMIIYTNIQKLIR